MFYAADSAFALDYDPELRAKYYAATLVHEAAHVRERWNKRPYRGRDGELTALTVQLEVLRALDAPASLTTCLEEIIENIDDPAYQYWEGARPPCGS